MNKTCKKTLPSLLVLGCLSACGTPPVTPAVAQAATLGCAELVNMKIAAASIGLPTSGAIITGTKVVAASGTGAGAVGEYCLASGNIMPVDAAAPNIQFQVALPASWNSKAVMFGGAGLNGTVPDLTGSGTFSAYGAATPLSKGYAVFAGDSGHQVSPTTHPVAFMLNQEAYDNYMVDALKKTRDAAIQVVKAAYGNTPKKAYFFGQSKGGAEALLVGSSWPADWDGIVALYPARPSATQLLGQLHMSQALAVPGAYPNRAKRGALYQAALQACDAQDGVSDGLISDEKKCEATFNPASALLNGVPLRCAGGFDTGDTCWSDAQLKALKTLNDAYLFSFPLASGATSYPGMNVYTSDLGAPGDTPIQSQANASALGSIAPAFPYTAPMPALTGIADAFTRYYVTRDLSFDYLTLDPSKPGAYAARFSQMSSVDAHDNNLGAFAAKGGKLMLVHGTADMIISSRGSESYVLGLQASLGASSVDSFLRFYLVPGYGHAVGTSFTVAWDHLSAIENWVEKGIDPANKQVMMDLAGVPGRTRPLCMYPTWAKYNGSGDLNSAASFTCATR